MRPLLFTCALGAALSLPAAHLEAQEGPARAPVLFDTALGNSLDDAFALALVLASPELDLRGVTTVSGDTQVRALMACRFLTATGRRHVPVAAGVAPQPPRKIGGQYQYYYHPDVLFNRTTRPQKESAVDFLASRLRGQQGKVSLIACGPLTNVARLLKEKPQCKEGLRRVLFLGENVTADLDAARTVLASGVPLLVLRRDLIGGLDLGEEDVRKVFSPHTPLTQQVEALYQLAEGDAPTLTAALAVALCVEERLCDLQKVHLDVDDHGGLRRAKGMANATLATSVRADDFRKWYVERMASCVPPARRPSRIVPRGAMPHRVHVAEDYDTDIERRWWMGGKAETKNLPPHSRRACRGVLTHDFDDLLGHPKAMYTAVIFNPVPGPPMGKNTRLAFRYFLRGTRSLRVQIYSLTSGYHRHLVLNDLPEGRWEEAAVDMTGARRPDGTGGPLSEGERIDDIQFYASPEAELIVDDVVLYDAAVPEEKRPFPRHVHFAGGFDTGAQGKEWPGTFDIVAGKGYFWKAARAVENRELGAPWLRLHLRGARTLDDRTQFFFRYRLSGANALRVWLVAPGGKEMATVALKDLAQDRWSEAIADFTPGTRAGDQVEEVHLLLPAGAEMLVDDVLLFTPGD